MNKWFGVMPLSAALFYQNVKIKKKNQVKDFVICVAK